MVLESISGEVFHLGSNQVGLATDISQGKLLKHSGSDSNKHCTFERKYS
jgi:hypothetical protein